MLPSHEFSPSPVYITCTGNQQKVLFKGHYSKHSLNLPIVLCTSAWFCSTPDTGANRTKRRLTHLSVSHFEIEFRHFEHQSVANPTGRSPSSIMGVEVEVEDDMSMIFVYPLQSSSEDVKDILHRSPSASAFFQQLAFCSHANINMQPARRAHFINQV